MDIDEIMEREEQIKNFCRVDNCNNKDSAYVMLVKDGYKVWIDVDYIYSYYHRSQTYYEPEEESYTFEELTKWSISDIEKDSDDYKVDNFDEVLKQLEESLTEDEIIEALLKEKNLEQ